MGWFFERGRTNGATKLAMAGTPTGLVAPISSIVGLLILYS